MAQSGVVIGILIVSFGLALMVERALLGGMVRVMGRARDERKKRVVRVCRP